MQVLTVHAPFGDYRRGDIIQDPKKIKAVLDAGHEHNVTRTEVADHFFLPDGEAHEAEKAAAKA